MLRLRALVAICLLGTALAATSSHSTTHTCSKNETVVGHEFKSLYIYKNYNPTTEQWEAAGDPHNYSLLAHNCTDIEKLQHEAAQLSSDLKCLHDECVSHSSTSHGSHADHAHAHPPPAGQFVIIYVVFILGLGCVCRYVIKRLELPLQYTVVLLGIGMIYEAIEFFVQPFGDLGIGGELVRTIDPHMILFLFIPALIFESAFSTDYHTIVKEKEQAALLAGPGVVINTMLTGAVLHYFNNYSFTWSFSFMMGAILSATDPVAVVALLKELGASKRLSTLIEAESLLNDGTAFVAFTLLKAYAASTGTSFDLVDALQQLLLLAVCGTLWGIAVGVITYRSLSMIFADFQVEITVTLVACYVGFYTGEAMKVSGVLVVVFLGLVVSRNRSAITPAIEESMHGFWEMVGFIANTVLFFITGQIMIFKIASTRFISPIDIIYLILLYICIHGTRFLTIWVMFPVLESVGYGCTKADAAVMLYGGLRGAIGLALALIVETEPGFQTREKDLVLFHVSGIVILTLLVNASTIGNLVNYLGLNKPPADSRQLLKGATDHIHEETHEMIHKLKNDKNFAGANWTKVEELMPNYEKLLNIYDNFEESESDPPDSFPHNNGEPSATDSMGTADSFENDVHDPHHHTAAKKLDLDNDVADAFDTAKGDVPRRESDSIIDKAPTFLGRIGSIGDVLSQFRANEKEEREKRHVERRFIFVMKASFWGQFEKGLIGQEAVRVLVEAADAAIDENDLSTTRGFLKQYFRIPRYLKWMHNQNQAWVRFISERLLFGNLGFAIELAGAFVNAAEQAHEFGELLLHSGTVAEQHVKDVKEELDEVTKWISDRSHRVQTVYPEVHQAIQTEHAAHYLLHQSKHVIEHLYHKGFLEEAEFGRVEALADAALNKLFRTGYSEFLETSSDEEIFLANPLFAHLTDEEKEIIVAGADTQALMDKDQFVFQRRNDAASIFIITRGAVAVLERTDPGSSAHGGNLSDFMNSYWRQVEIKGRNEMFEIWPVLHESPQIHSFRVTSENCSGFSVRADALHTVAQTNHHFWETLWKTAAVELVKYFFKDDEVFSTFDLSHLENFMDEQDLEYVDSQAEDSLILVNTTCAILLNGSVLHMESPGADPIAAPVVLMENDVPYVPFEDCVVIYLDLNQRGAAHVFEQFGAHTMRKMLNIGGRNVLQNVADHMISEEQVSIPIAARAYGSATHAHNNPLTQLSRVRSRTTIASGGTVPPPALRPLDVNRAVIPETFDVDELDEQSGWEVVKILLDQYDYMDDITRYARQRMKEHFQAPLASPRPSNKAADEKEDGAPQVLRMQSAGPTPLKKFARPSTVNLMAPHVKPKRRSLQFAGMPMASPAMGRATSGGNQRVDATLASMAANARGGRGTKASRPTIVMSKSYQRQTKNINAPQSMDFDADGTLPLHQAQEGWVIREETESPRDSIPPPPSTAYNNTATAIEMAEHNKQQSVLDVDGILSDLPKDNGKFEE